MYASCDRPTIAACRCGRVALRLEARPIVHAACYCASCQEAGRLIEQLPDAQPVLDLDGGTDYLLFRKDRVRCTQGGERLQELRLKPDSLTRRMVAGCCNTGMFLDVTNGHWLTLYRGRIAGLVQPLQFRVMIAERPEGVVIPSDTPAYPGRAGKLILKLMTAWAAMGFLAPDVEGVPRPGQAAKVNGDRTRPVA